MLHDISRHRLQSQPPVPNRHDIISDAATTARGTNSVNYISGASDITSLAPGKNGQFTIVQSGVIDYTNFSITTSNPGAGNYIAETVIISGFDHNLGYVPGFIGFIRSGSEYIPLPFSDYQVGSTSQALWVYIYPVVTADVLNIVVNTMAYGTGWVYPLDDIKWFLFQQTSS